MTEDLKQRIENILLDNDIQKILLSEDFYFEKAVKAYDEYMSFKKNDEIFLRELATVDYTNIEDKAISDNDILEFKIKLETLVTYCDSQAKDKYKYNQYEDKRVIARAGIYQNDWTRQLINLKIGKKPVATSIQNALNFIINPQNSISILSEEHRKMISFQLLKKPYNADTFVSDIKDFFTYLPLNFKNENNRTHVYSRIIYSLKDYWCKIVSGLLARDNGSWKDEFFDEMGNSDFGVLWWSPKPVSANETLPKLATKINEEGFFYLYYSHHGQVTYRARVVDFCLAPDYDKKSSEWKSKSPVWYNEKSSGYNDEKNQAAIMFLVDEFTKIQHPFSIEFFQMYKNLALPNRNNLSPFATLDINEIDDYMINIDSIIDVLKIKKQIIFQGAPGTGKTYTAKDVAEKLIFNKISKNKNEQAKILAETNQYKMIQFHPSYTYEDFVRGIVVETLNGAPIYKSVNKVLGEFAKNAKENYEDSIRTPEYREYLDWLNNVFLDYLDSLNSRFETGKVYLNNTDVYIKEIDKDNKRIRYYKENYYKHKNPNDSGFNISFEQILGLVVKTKDVILPFTPITFTVPISHYELESNLVADFRLFLKDKSSDKSSVDYPIILRKNFVLIIDEINRANLPAVLGELIYGLEYRGEKVDSMYAIDGDNSLILPPNLHIIGTMNTADRSVGIIDYAIRRRFAFVDVLPKVLSKDEAPGFDIDLFKAVSALFVQNIDEYINNSDCKLISSDLLSEEFRPEDVWIGHSYFIMQDKDGKDVRNMRLKYEIIPILKEYVKDGIFKDKKGVEDIIDSL